MRFQNRVCPFFFILWKYPSWMCCSIAAIQNQKSMKTNILFFFYCLCLFPQLRLQDVGTCLFNMDKKTRENFNGFWVFIVLPLGGFVTNTTCNGICCPPARINQVRWSQNKPTMSAQLSLHFLCRPNQKLLHSYSFFFFFSWGENYHWRGYTSSSFIFNSDSELLMLFNSTPLDSRPLHKLIERMSSWVCCEAD